jgi:hypothetical protein
MKQQYNYDMFKRIFEQISNHPEYFDMSSWECGTTKCIAGWACFLAGLKYDNSIHGEDCDWHPPNARRILNISMEESDILFHEATEFVPYMIIRTLIEQAGSEVQESIEQINNRLNRYN